MEQIDVEIGIAELDPAALFHGRYDVFDQEIKDRLLAYLRQGTYPGRFLEGVLTNDLQKAVNSARTEEYAPWYDHLPNLVWWVYNQAPSGLVGPDGYARHVRK